MIAVTKGAFLLLPYRVRSQHGTFFRQWATRRLEELLRKGFTIPKEKREWVW
jgi:hypothetical protein